MKDAFLKFEKVIGAAKCKYLSDAFEVIKEHGVNLDLSAPESNRAENAFGFGTVFSPYIELVDEIRPYLLPLIEPNEELQHLGIYTREYFKGGAIKKHLDFKSQISVSLCIRHTAKNDWPLKAELGGKVVEGSARVGDMLVVTNADKNLHWRDPLECEEGECVTQVIYFWKVLSPDKSKG